MKTLLTLPIAISCMGLSSNAENSRSIEALFEHEFGMAFPGIRQITPVECETDNRLEKLCEFEDGRFLVLAGGNEYHAGREVLKTEGSPRYNPISGTLYHPNPEKFRDPCAVPLEMIGKERKAQKSNGYNIESDLFEVHDIGGHLDKVFPGWKVFGGNVIPLKEGKDQFGLSVYQKKVGLETYGESNCELSAGYTIMRYLINDSLKHKATFASFPKKNETRAYCPEVEEPDTLKKAIDKGYTKKADSLAFEEAYINMRRRALSMDPGFVLGGGLIAGQQSGMLEWFAHDYGLASFDAYQITDYNAEVSSDRFTKHIEDDRPVMFGIMNAGHAPHVIAVHGFMHYQRTVKQLWWEKTEWRTILHIYDGREFAALDVTQFYNNGGWGCFNEYYW